MRQELVEKLSKITDEEKIILERKKGVEKKIYSSRKEFVIDKQKMLANNELIRVRTHTRFVDFPMHKHDYIEVVYVVKGSMKHVINDSEVLMEQGDMLFLNQHICHSIQPAGKDDVAVNFLIQPQFFDISFEMMTDKKNALADFIISILEKDVHAARFLHFRLDGIVEIENIVENLVYSLVSGDKQDDMINRNLMGVLFLYLLKYIGTLKKDQPNNYYDMKMAEVLGYIENNYAEASLTELADKVSMTTSVLCRFIRKKTGSTFSELLQQKRFSKAMNLLRETELSVGDIIHSVGYENNSFFHRKFREIYKISPKEYRNQIRSNVQKRT